MSKEKKNEQKRRDYAKNYYDMNKEKKLKYQRLYSEKKNGKKIKQVKTRYYDKNKWNILEKNRQRRESTCMALLECNIDAGGKFRPQR